jgi:hypothetical protein
MPIRWFLSIIAAAILAAALTIAAAYWLFPNHVWTGPATMAVIAGLA